MLEMQEPDGQWLKGNSDFALKSATVCSVTAAWDSAKPVLILSKPDYVDAAIRNAEFCLRKQLSNGWFRRLLSDQSEQALIP